jgi:hypothetical protein
MPLLRRRNLDGSRRVVSLLLSVSEFFLSRSVMLKAKKKATPYTLTLAHLISMYVNRSMCAESLVIETATLCADLTILYSRCNALLLSRRPS